MKQLTFLLTLLLTLGVLNAKSLVYVSDQVEIPVRADKSSRSAIIKMAPSGEQFELLQRTTSGWTKIKTPEGEIGWIGSRYLMNTPAAREKFSQIQNKYTAQTIQYKQKITQIKNLEKKLKLVQKTYQDTLISKAKISSKIEHIEKTYQNSLEIEHHNQQLNSQVLQLSAQIKLLKNNNVYEQDRSARNWFIIGALVLLFGGIIGSLIIIFFGKKQQNKSYF